MLDHICLIPKCLNIGACPICGPTPLHFSSRHYSSLIHFYHFTDTSDAHSREQSGVKDTVVAVRVGIAVGFVPDLKKSATHCKMHLETMRDKTHIQKVNVVPCGIVDCQFEPTVVAHP